MGPRRACRPFALLIALVLAHPQIAGAETILDRVLARIDAGPVLSFGLHLNYAEQGEAAAEQVTTTVDGSVTVITYWTPSSGTAASGPITVTDPVDSSAAPGIELEISTSSIGATNVGAIEVEQDRLQLAPQIASPGLVVPGVGLAAVNAAANRSDVLGSASVLSTSAARKEGSISTSAIGATNTGSINVVLSTSAATAAPIP